MSPLRYRPCSSTSSSLMSRYHYIRRMPMVSRIAGWLLLVSLPLLAAAQSYPSKPIRIVLGYSTGGTSDNLGRMMTDKLTQPLGQSLLIDTRQGATANTPAQIVPKPSTNPYTLPYSHPPHLQIT